MRQSRSASLQQRFQVHCDLAVLPLLCSAESGRRMQAIEAGIIPGYNLACIWHAFTEHKQPQALIDQFNAMCNASTTQHHVLLRHIKSQLLAWITALCRPSAGIRILGPTLPNIDHDMQTGKKRSFAQHACLHYICLLSCRRHKQSVRRAR